MPRDEKLKLKNRRARLDEAIEGEGPAKRRGELPDSFEDDEGSDKPLQKKKAEYNDDFELEAKIIELKDKKKELLRGISGKSEKEKKEIRKQLEELNDKIMDLENE